MKNKDISKFYSPYYVAQIKAVSDRLQENESYLENKIRRWYSKNFFTPLHDTFALSWEFILKHYYESRIEDMSFNQVFELAVDNYLPEIAAEREAEDEAYADSLVAEQERSLQLKKAKAMKDKVLGKTGHVEKKDIAMQFEDENLDDL